MAQGGKRGSGATATRYFAAVLRLLRERAGLSQEELGRQIGYTGAQVSAVETCVRIAKPEFIDRADDVLGAGGVLKAAAEYLRLDRYPEFFKAFARLEAEALSVGSYQTHLLHGLLQTEEYARALMECRYPPLEEEEIEQLVVARVERAALFSRKPRALLSFVIEESVLRRGIGSASMTRAQLEHLVELAALRNVALQVMPSRNGQHAGMDGPMTVIETPEHEHLVYLEAQEHSVLVSDPDEVARYAQRYAMIRTQALGLDESVSLIKQLAGEL